MGMAESSWLSLSLVASKDIPLDQPGTTDDCGFYPFSDDVAAIRDTAFPKIIAPILDTRLAYDQLK